MRYEYIKLASLNWKSRAVLYAVFSILIAAATINTVGLFINRIPCIYRIAGIIFQLVFMIAMAYSIISVAVVSDRIARLGCIMVSGAGMKPEVLIIILFGLINVSFAVYLIVSNFIFPEGFRGFNLIIMAPLLFYFIDSYVYTDQDYLFIGTRKLMVPLKEIVKVDITRRKLGMDYINAWWIAKVKRPDWSPMSFSKTNLSNLS
jgi:hypothetical protein